MLSQRAALLALTAALVALGLWLLRPFLPALAWAAVLAVGTWPLYTRFRRLLPASRRAQFWVPLAFTLLVGVVFVLPLTLFAIEVGREALVVVRWAIGVEDTGIPAPDWLGHLPFGSELVAWWQSNLSDPHAARALLGRIDRSLIVEWTRSIGVQLLARSTTLVFALLALFFLYRDGLGLVQQLARLANRAFGPTGERLGTQVVGAIRGAIDGLVLVGLGEGLVLGIGYAVVGLPHVVLLAALTGVLAMIPFGAPLVFGLGALYLLSQSNIALAIAIGAYGVFVTFVADHFVRPVLIGSAIRLPFLWVLLGIFGGIESFGLLGLFLGPAIMAALIALWREYGAASPDAVMDAERLKGRSGRQD
jgi:predicted PurR-regulated permease PerM